MTTDYPLNRCLFGDVRKVLRHDTMRQPGTPPVARKKRASTL